MNWAYSCLCAFVCLSVAKGDTPANCTYGDVEGKWTFYMTEETYDSTVNCSGNFDFNKPYVISLEFPDMAVDEDGNIGFWTLIYNQGFEVVINDRKFFAFSLYKKDIFNKVKSICNQTFPGWVHSKTEQNWGCYVGQKHVVQTDLSRDQARDVQSNEAFNILPYRNSKQFIKGYSDCVFTDDINRYYFEINKRQPNWRAIDYGQFRDRKLAEMIRMAGGRRSARAFPPTAIPTPQQLKATEALPKSFDWRNQAGVNFVSPIRNQGSCGSCYAFGSMAMHEARLRVVTNNTVQKVFSTQDIVSCSEYSQGCDGGFPYLIAGKYGQDFGFIEEDCFTYEGHDAPCKKTTCERHFTQDYYYIGGFYGACNEPLMREELVKNGPIAVSFEVYKDFVAYKGGIYEHTGLEDKFNPWEITNHVVLVVGYGEENDVPYWIVKNSWGPAWGEEGFFRIRRGSDECSIESMAVGNIPIV